MSPDQREALKEKLKHGQYTTAQVRDIIKKEYGIEYTAKQVWVILKKMGMRHAKPYPHEKFQLMPCSRFMEFSDHFTHKPGAYKINNPLFSHITAKEIYSIHFQQFY